ncbi:MAG: hypothetical protein CMJ85_12875 [Planctomycetes bacterium]|nr:hypothetical protein [Planctomycetota bacterium]
MKLRPRVRSLRALADRYGDVLEDDEFVEPAKQVAAQGFLTKAQLQQVGEWKSPRSAGRIQENTETFVQEMTGFALSAGDEMSRMLPLTCLSGVGWPTASVILHFFHPDPYPILDFRALYSVGASVPSQYRFPFWWEYVQCARGLRKKSGLSMRDLDKALWQYSAENQTADSA